MKETTRPYLGGLNKSKVKTRHHLRSPTLLSVMILVFLSAGHSFGAENSAKSTSPILPAGSFDTNPAGTSSTLDAPRWVAAIHIEAQDAVGLRWLPVPGATGYKVFRSTTSGSGYEEIAAPTTPQHFDTGVSPGNTYYYVLQAVAGDETSPISPEKSVTIKVVEVVKPEPPRWRKILVDQRAKAISLTWRAVPGAVAYNIYRRESFKPAGKEDLIGSVQSPADTYLDKSNLKSRIEYVYQVSALDSSFEESEKSAAQKIKYAIKAQKFVAKKELRLAAPRMMERIIRIPELNTEEYDLIRENTFKDAIQNPLSTFSLDVDTASYSNIRRFVNMGELPPKDAVRIEELINYFGYDYPEPSGKHPFSITTEEGPCPWNTQNRLVHIGIKGRGLNYEDVKPANLVFLIDSSGSMKDRSKLPLLQKSFKLLLGEMGEQDRIAIVAYAGSAGLVLPSTPATHTERILEALESLAAGGSTAGGAGIELAYTVARENLIREGNNRVILATDGDFNVGVSSTAELVRRIEEKRKEGIYLTILGFGMGNYKDGRMEQISNAGNGNYFYIDNIREAEKVFVREMRANMFTIAGDVKIQIEFNPAKIAAWRLVGYENRLLAKEDFADDTKDAGELGAGHTVTALYEIVPAGADFSSPTAPPLKYQESRIASSARVSDEIMTVKFRYKPIGQDESRLIERSVSGGEPSFEKTSEDFRFSAAVAGFGMLLRDSRFKGDLSYEKVLELAKGAKGTDENGDRAEFIGMVNTCSLLTR